ncbi:MAG: hypothetical protein KDD47_16865 [Acidobacteria bacterium]|nr:hypothetical protein [Acidobacteriota bacterium]
MNTYVIAVRREHRQDLQPNWAEPLFRIEGLEVAGDPKRFRLLASGSEEALRQVRPYFSTFCHIEPALEHFPL